MSKLTLSFLLLFSTTSLLVAQDSGDDATLKQQLDSQASAFAERMPAPMIEKIDNSIKGVEDTGILDNAIKVGDKEPDFELPDAVGNPVSLSGLLKEGAVVLTWYRGNW